MSTIRIALALVSYLRIRDKDLVFFQWVLPCIFSALACFAYYNLLDQVRADANALISSINGLLANLTGFYIAGLGAIATFNGPTLDAKIKGESSSIVNYRGGKIIEEALTRRRFLCIIFGYCSVICIVLYLLGAVLMVSKLPSTNSDLIRFATVFVYNFLFGSMLTATAHGLYYLTGC